ncbi:hypothetical protein HYC85_024424, partial [Camellia sinensis]
FLLLQITWIYSAEVCSFGDFIRRTICGGRVNQLMCFKVIAYYRYKYIYILLTCFGWMVKPKDSWLFPQHSARQLPRLNCTSTLLQQGQQNVFPSSMNHCTVSTGVAFPGFRVPGLHGSGKGQTNAAHGLFHCLPTHLDCLPYTSSPYVKKEPNVVSEPTQRRFIIFDQSRNQTRLFLSPIRPPAQNSIVAPTKFLDACDMGGKGQPDKMVQNFPTKPAIQEKSNEIQIIGEGSEMHEDTEEINALLYSDDDGGDSEEDEVTSTDRSPFTIKGGSYKKREHVEDTTAEDASSDGVRKRQKLIDGGYKKSSLMDTVSSAKPEYEDDAEGRTQGEDLDSIIGTEQSSKDKIRETVKFLECLIPSVKSKDPLSVIEEAISYLKYLKVEAKALGVS